MNTKNLKSYAPKARKQFIEAVKKRAAHFGIYEDRIAEVRIEGGAAIIEGRAFTRKEGEQRKRLEGKLAERGYDMFTREIAYTWFNRLAALRYMEIHDYFDHGFRVLSPAKSHLSNADSLPEILNHASDVAESLNLDKDHIIELQLAGDKEEELYRELLLGQCHQLAKIMPQIFKGLAFESIDDATELLLPNNLTKTDSILKGLINDIPEEDWQEIEVIGWLYQFYISEHKDSVIGKVVKSEDIPAATQLFTPNWIVKYLVQNSVGRQWLATYPDSELKGKMEYYIEPAEQSQEVIEQLKAITPTSINPEEIKVLDPACGSGHILVEVYEVLREIYLERGYRLREIPELILTKNIYGLDIDDRAAQLAGFALMMKAREDDRRIFQRVEDGEVSLNVFSLQSTEHLDITKLWKALDLEGSQQTGSTGGLFDGLNSESESFLQPTGIFKEYFELLQMLKSSFLQAKALGSLIQIDNHHLQNLVALKKLLQEKEAGSDPAAKRATLEFLPIINQAILLALRYDAVVANPPYMGAKFQTPIVKEYLRNKYKGYDRDLFSAFIVNNLDLAKPNGQLGYMTPFVWMFISSYEQLREKLLNADVITTLIQLEYSGFDGATVPICTFTLAKGHLPDYRSSYVRLSDFKGASNQGPKALEAIQNHKLEWFYTSRPDDMKKVPGMPIAYWVSPDFMDIFNTEKSIDDIAPPRIGMMTTDNNRFLRYWFEVNDVKIGYNFKSKDEAEKSEIKWFPYNKGGSYRKWAGNGEYVVNWQYAGKEIIENGMTSFRGKNFYFKSGITWSDVSSAIFSCRFSPEGRIFDIKGTSCFPEAEDMYLILAVLNSKVGTYILKFLNPTISFQSGDIRRVPIPYKVLHEKLNKQDIQKLITYAQDDWDSFETSWEFQINPLVKLSNGDTGKLSSLSLHLFQQYDGITQEVSNTENEINYKLAEIYNLQNDLDFEIQPNEVTLSSNPFFRYSSEHHEQRTSDLYKELLSYSIGCMMGRYSLNRSGLVYSLTSNEGFKELEAEGAYQTFPADDDGIIPLASEEWLFDDDATTRFKEFVKKVWGEEHLSENLEFVAESLCLHALKPLSNKKGSAESAMDTVRRYFSTQFFKDHCKTYKKRPIYWLFSSGKEKAFECLVYLHRYNEGTLSRMRTEYVTPLMGKYEAQHTLLSEQQLQATGTEARGIEKDLKSLEKKQAELRAFDEQLKHYAEMRITLDLDDGVKANYGKFGNLLADVKAIHGKAVK